LNEVIRALNNSIREVILRAKKLFVFLKMMK